MCGVYPMCLQRLLDAGALLRGKTQMDELAYSLNGENVHYGTPINPAAPGHIPGGSSSGSAVSLTVYVPPFYGIPYFLDVPEVYTLVSNR